MMESNKKIKDIYNISFDPETVPEKDKCPMNDWYNKLIHKTYQQLDLFDVTRMLIQKIFLELAVSKSLIFIRENPFCGQRYEGELLELLSKLDKSYFVDEASAVKEILLQALEKNQRYEWLDEEEREEFKKIAKDFLKKL